MPELEPGLNIRLAADQPGGGSTFVEIEDDHGQSIKIGKVTRHDDDTWSIRITAADIAALPAPKPCPASTPSKFSFPCNKAAGHDGTHTADIPCGRFSWHDPVEVNRG